MSRAFLSDSELRGLSEDGDGIALVSQALFAPADFSDASRAAHRIFGAAAARVSAAVGGVAEPLPPELGLVAPSVARQCCAESGVWAVVLELTGQFRARAALALVATTRPVRSEETIAVLMDSVARDIEVAFRVELQKNVAVEMAPWSVGSGCWPVAAQGDRGMVALDFDLERRAGGPARLRLYGEASLVRDLAALVRPQAAVAAQVAAPQPIVAEPAALDALEQVEEVEDTSVRLAAEIGGSVLPLVELAALRAGQVIRLDRLAGELATLSALGREMARGEVVVEDGYLALRLVEVASPAEWLNPLTPETSGSRGRPAVRA